jgi:uncharacterized protein
VTQVLRFVRKLPRLLVAGLIRAYQLVISPLLGLLIAPGGQICRFYPSCSEYALVAVQRHGALRGGWLAARRLLRCHPWNPGGVDHVPGVAACAPHPTHLSDQISAADNSAATNGHAESSGQHIARGERHAA